jgi:hypothetical protein
MGSITPRTITRRGHIACTETMRNAYKYFIGNVMGEKAGKSTLAAEDNIKTNVMDIRRGNVNKVRLTL